MWPLRFIMTATSTAWSSECSSIPARMKSPLSRASGRSVDVRMQTAAIGLPMLKKKLDSSGSVPESLTTANEFIWRLL